MTSELDECRPFTVGRVSVSPRFGGHGGIPTQWEFESCYSDVKSRMSRLPQLWPGRLIGFESFYLPQGPRNTPMALAVAVAHLLDAPEWNLAAFEAVIAAMLEYHEMIKAERVGPIGEEGL